MRKIKIVNRQLAWTKVAEQFIRKSYKTMTAAQMAEALGVKIFSLRMKMYSMGLYKQKNNYWTVQETQFLLDNYKIMGDTEIAKRLGRTIKQIEKKRGYLSLKRTDREIEAIKERNKRLGAWYSDKAIKARQSQENNLKKSYALKQTWQKEKRRELSGLPLQTKLLAKAEKAKKPVIIQLNGQVSYCHSVCEAAKILGKSLTSVTKYLKGRVPRRLDLKIKYANERREIKTIKSGSYLSETDFRFT